MSTKRILVIGGGPAGLMAAGQAAGAGCDVHLLEKQAQPGRKLSITGKGRCNLTNIAELDDFLGHFGKNGRFLRQAFNRFFSDDLITFLRSIGVDVQSERGGRVFPAGERAPDVTRALVSWTRQQGVKIHQRATVQHLLLDERRITGVRVNDADMSADAVILATGGASYPATGSTGDGYRLAAEAGHTIIPVRPALVPLATEGSTATRLKGLGLRNVRVAVFVNGKKRHEAFGEMTFMSFGVSGPIILSLSRLVVDALARKHEVVLSLDLKPALDEKKLDARLLRDLSGRGKEPLESILRGLLPSELIPECLSATGLTGAKPGHQVRSEERRRLLDWLKDFRLTVIGHRSFDEAIVTAGGVDTREIDPRTMASKGVAGLYVAGEVLDIDGDTGGYNLQAAFSTGWLAGLSAAEPA